MLMKPVKSSEEANKIRMNGATVNFGERGGKLCIKNTVHFKNLILKIFFRSTFIFKAVKF